jgi:hypothetical protein
MLNEQLAGDDDAIAAAVAEHPDTPIFASFPGVGPVLTGVLLAEIDQDRNRFPTAQVLLAEAGLAPVTPASGRSKSVRFRYAANSRLREACQWWAFNSLKVSPWANAAFRQARDERAPALPPRPSRARGPLDAGAMALLDRPHPLRPHPPHQRRDPNYTLTFNHPPARRHLDNAGTFPCPQPGHRTCTHDSRLTVGVCLVHRIGNILTKVAQTDHDAVRGDY